MATNAIVSGLKVDVHYTPLHRKVLAVNVTTRELGRVEGTLRTVKNPKTHFARIPTYRFEHAFKEGGIVGGIASRTATVNISQEGARYIIFLYYWKG